MRKEMDTAPNEGEGRRTVTFEEILARDGHLVYKTRGVSMEPMLRQNRDLVMISVPSSRLKPLDVALYRRGSAYVLHRVIRDAGDHYLFRGDNTYALEAVPDSAVLGVLTGFVRKGRQVDCSSLLYRFYAAFWNIIYPLRLTGVRVRSGVARILRGTRR